MKIGSVSGASQDYSVQRGSDGADTAATIQAPAKSEPVKAASKTESMNEKEDTVTQKEFSEEWMKKSVDQANKALAQHNRFIERDVHPITHTVMYKIMDSTTQEVIAEYPPKKIQDMVAKMWELAGLFVDEKA